MLAVPGNASLRVYDVSGRLIRSLVDGRLPAGMHEVMWNGRDENGAMAASGVYFYRLSAGEIVQTRKMVLLR
jgi:flagellar hook assembly protein FlgD